MVHLYKFSISKGDIFNIGTDGLKVSDSVENNVEKEKNTMYQHLIPFSTMLLKTFFQRLMETGLCGKG